MTPTQIYSIPVDQVIVLPDRNRREFKPVDIRELSQSILQYGQLQPGICIKRKDSKLELVIGERRLKACALAGVDYEYVLRANTPEGDALLKVIELEENVQRVDLTFSEKALAVLELHELYQGKIGAAVAGTDSGGHTIADTAERLGKSVGNISEDLELAFWIKEIPEVAEARNKTEAKKIVKRIKESLKRTVALDKAIAKQEPLQDIAIDQTAALYGIDSDTERKPDTLPPVIAQKSEKEKLEDRLMEYDRRILLGSMEDQLPKLTGLFDIIMFDPPWGVGFDKVSSNTGYTGTESYEDDPEDFNKQFPTRLETLWNIMSKDSILLVFFGMVNYDFVYKSIENQGFETNGLPFIWHKKGTHRTRNPDIWPGRCYEPIVYARKGKKVLSLKGAPDIIPTPMPTPRIKADHPSAKHPAIYKELLERVAAPGDRILDPMCGSGMLGVACESLRATHALDWWMIERKENFRDLSLFNCHKGYEKIVGDYDKPKEPTGVKPDFRELSPGTTEWKSHWKDYSEDHEEMLKWRKGA